MFREGIPAVYTETITSALSGSGVTAWPPEPELRETDMQLFHIYQTKKMAVISHIIKIQNYQDTEH